MRRIISLFLSLIMMCTALSGCATVKAQIAYTVYPLGFLCQRLTGSLIPSRSIQEDGIVQRGQLRPDYESILKDSQVFFHIGTMEPYYSIYSDVINADVTDTIDLSSMNAVYDFQRYTPVVTDGVTTYVESPYYRSDVFDLVDTENKDLYLWTDPIAMLSMAKNIRDWLKKTYPDDVSAFESNYTELENDLINLDAQYQALSSSNEANSKVIRFVTMTASFGNWQKTYGFQVYPVILSKYGVLPNEKQLAVIEQRIVEDGVKYIVYEPNMTDDMIALYNRIQSDLGLTQVELSNLSSLTEDDVDNGKDYLSIMYENLSVLQTMVEDRPTPAAAEGSEETAEIHDNFGQDAEKTVEETMNPTETQTNG